MVDLAEIQAAYYMVAATGVLVAAIYYVYNMRISQRNSKAALDTRQAQLLMQIYDRNCDPEHQGITMEVMSWDWKDLDEFTAKYGAQSNPSEFKKWAALNQWYEGIGILIKNELISPKLVDDLISATIMQYWEKYGPIIVEFRKRFNIPQSGEGVELLYNSVRRIAVGEHPELGSGIGSLFDKKPQ